MAEDLARLDTWLGQILRGLAPGERCRAMLKLAQALRRSNLARISANTQPDGSKMEPKKARFDERKRLVQAAGAKMFKGLRYSRNWKIDVREDALEIFAASRVAERVAEINQFGETATVGRLRNGQRIRYRYPERHLLGFSDADDDLTMDLAAGLVEPQA